MTPVINPWIFYLMSVVDGIGCSLTILFVAVAVVLLFFVVKGWVEQTDYHNAEESRNCYKAAKKSGVILAIIMALDVFIPTTDTITKMIVAQNVTYERVEAATDVVQTVYEDIMSMFEEKKVE